MRNKFFIFNDSNIPKINQKNVALVLVKKLPADLKGQISSNSGIHQPMLINACVKISLLLLDWPLLYGQKHSNESHN